MDINKTPVNPTRENRNIDSRMSRLCNSLKSSEQQAQDQQTYIIEEMEFILSQNPDREDIAACISDIKQRIKSDESEHWKIADGWGQHFDGTTPGKPDGGEDEPDGNADDYSD